MSSTLPFRRVWGYIGREPGLYDAGSTLSAVEMGKRLAGYSAVDENVKDNTVVGIGSGTTVAYVAEVGYLVLIGIGEPIDEVYFAFSVSGSALRLRT